MLTQEHTLKLDGIVQQMIDNQESDKDIRFIIDDTLAPSTDLEKNSSAFSSTYALSALTS